MHERPSDKLRFGVRALIAFISALIVMLPLQADETSASKTQPQRRTSLGTILIEQGLLVGMSLIGSSNPKTYGTVLLVVAPLAAANGPGGQGNAEVIGGTAGVMAVGIYNLGWLQHDNRSKANIFVAEFIAHNLLCLGGQQLGRWIDSRSSKTDNRIGLTYDFSAQAPLIVYQHAFPSKLKKRVS